MNGAGRALAQELLRIARDGHDDRDMAAKICRACVACLDVHGAAISLLTATTSRTTLSATDPTAATLEDLQFTLGEGACIEAATSGAPVLVSDVHDHVRTTRWPVFARAVAEQTRARALFALPLQVGTINLGVLDLYRDTPGPLREHDLRDAVAAADTATLMLLAAPVHAGDAEAAGHPITDGHPTGEQHPDGRHADRNGRGEQAIHHDDRWPMSLATSSRVDWCSPRKWTETAMRRRHPGITSPDPEGSRT